MTPPLAPTGLQAIAGDRQIALDWADNADPVAGYRVYRNGSPIATPTSSGYTDTGLTNGNTYTYRVTALDQAGNESAASNQVTASPQAPVTPPDETSYRLLQEPFAWVDATAGGTQVTLADDAQAAVALPFSFRYFGQPFTSVSVSSNGFLVFGSSSATAWVNTPLPNTGLPNGVVAAYWDDLNPALGGGIWHRTLGTAPNRKLVLSWVGIRHADTPGPISFQAVLEEGSNEILLAYQDTLHGNPAQDHGASATIGLESPDGTIGSQFLHNQALLAPLQATTALRYTNRAAGPPPPPDVTPPAVPTGLAATAGDSQVALDWVDNTDSIASYRVYRNGSPIASPRQRLHRYRPHERQHVHLPGHRPRPGGQRERHLQPGHRQPTSPGHATRRNQLSPPPGTVHLGGCNGRRHRPHPRRRRLGDGRPAIHFRYFGQPYTSVKVSSNGFLVFGPSAATAGSTRASQHGRSRTASLPPTGTTSTQPSAAASGTAPSAPPPTGNSSSAGSASATPTPPAPSASKPCSKKAGNEILLAYQDTLHGNPAQDHGASATIGLESPDGTIGSQFLHNQPLLAPYQATTGTPLHKPVGGHDSRAHQPGRPADTGELHPGHSCDRQPDGVRRRPDG